MARANGVVCWSLCLSGQDFELRKGLPVGLRSYEYFGGNTGRALKARIGPEARLRQQAITKSWKRDVQLLDPRGLQKTPSAASGPKACARLVRLALASRAAHITWVAHRV